MKKLLSFLMMLMTSAGAWAATFTTQSFGTGSTAAWDGTTLTISLGAADDFATWYASLPEYGDDHPNQSDVGEAGSGNIVVSGIIGATDISTLNTINSSSAVKFFDFYGVTAGGEALSSLTATTGAPLILPQGMDITVSDFTDNSSSTFKYIVSSTATGIQYYSTNPGNLDAALTAMEAHSAAVTTVTFTGAFTDKDNSASDASAIASHSVTSLTLKDAVGPQGGTINFSGNTTLQTLKVDGLTGHNSSKSGINVSGCSALVSVEISSAAELLSATVTGCEKLTTVKISDTSFQGSVDLSDNSLLANLDLSNMTIGTDTNHDYVLDLGHNAALKDVSLSAVTMGASRDKVIIDGDELNNLVLPNSFSGTLSETGATVKNTVTISGTEVTIEIGAGGSMADAMALLDDTTRKTMTKLTVKGTPDTIDFSSYTSLSKLDLGEATVGSLDALNVPSALRSIVLPAASSSKMTDDLKVKLLACPDLEYIYSPAGGDEPAYVYVNKTGGMASCMTNESATITAATTVKVESIVPLNASDVDMSSLKNASLYDLSKANVSASVANASLNTGKAPSYVIAPDGTEDDDLISFVGTSESYKRKAVYSHNGASLNVYCPSDDEIPFIEYIVGDATILNFPSVMADPWGYGKSDQNKVYAKTITSINALNNQAYSKITTINVETTLNAAFDIDNDKVTSVSILGNTNAKAVDLTGCSSLVTANFNGSKVTSVDISGVSSLKAVDFSNAVVSGVVNLSNTGLASFTSTKGFHDSNNGYAWTGTDFQRAVNLSNTKLASFTSEARFQDDINFSGTSTLASVNLAGATLSNSKYVDVYADADKSGTDAITALAPSGDNKNVYVPTGFPVANVRPNDPVIAEAVSPDALPYSKEDCKITINLADGQTLADFFTANPTLDKQYCNLTITGVITAADITYINNNITFTSTSETYGTTGTERRDAVLDLSGATIADRAIVASLKNSGLHNVLVPADWTTAEVSQITAANNPDLNGVASVTLTDGSATAVVANVLKPGTLRTTLMQHATVHPTTFAYNSSKITDVTVSGTLLACDIANGNLHIDDNGDFNKVGSEGTGVNRDAFNNAVLKHIGMTLAKFVKSDDLTTEYPENMTISTLCGDKVETVNISTLMTTLPENFMYNEQNMDTLTIPSNIKYIMKDAFKLCSVRWIKTTGERKTYETDYAGKYIVTDLNTHEVYVYASKTAYDEAVAAGTEKDAGVYERYTSGYGTYTFSSALKFIATGAFQTTFNGLTDVYALAKTPTLCEHDAFGKGAYTGWGGFAGNNAHPIQRSNYANGDILFTLFHFPHDTEDATCYTDVNRVYDLVDETSAVNADGEVINWPNMEEFYRAYAQALCGVTWNRWDPKQPTYFGEYDNNAWPTTSVDFGVTETSEGITPVATDASTLYGQSYSTFGLSDAVKAYISGQQTAYKTEYGEEFAKSAVSYMGWHQFVLTDAAYVPTEDKEVPTPWLFYFADTDWWTVCLPFSMTKAQMQSVFGTAVKLCEFTGVVKFENDVKGYSYNGQEYDVEKGTILFQFGRDLVASAANADDIVLKWGMPYMIKPGTIKVDEESGEPVYPVFDDLTRDQKVQVEICKALGYGTGAYSETVGVVTNPYVSEGGQYGSLTYADGTAIKQPKNCSQVEAKNEKDEVRSGDYYTYIGQFTRTAIPQFTYFLGWDSDAGAVNYFWQKEPTTIKNWNSYTCAITTLAAENIAWKNTGLGTDEAACWTLTGSRDDLSVFASELSTPAKTMLLQLDGGEMTAIKGVDPATGKVLADDAALGAVYDVRGKLVRRSGGIEGLPKGIYIVNHKKYVVK